MADFWYQVDIDGSVLYDMRKVTVELKEETKELAHTFYKDYVNDKKMYLSEEFKPYSYNEDDVNKYVSEAKANGNLNYVIINNNEVVGEIVYKNIINNEAYITIVLKNDSYKNRGIGTVALKQACILAKELKLTKLRARILKDNARAQYVFVKNQFELYANADEYIILDRSL